MGYDTCTQCAKNITRQTLSVQCVQCKKLYHSGCLRTAIPDISNLPGLSWTCDACVKKPTDVDTNTNLLLEKLNIIQSDISEVKSKQGDIFASLEFYGGKIDDFAKKIVEFEERIDVIPSMKKDIQSNCRELIELKSQVDHLQQQLRMNNLEVNGVPEIRQENTLEIIKQLFGTLGINASHTIDTCHRVPHRNSNNKHPKSIIVKLNSRSQKDAILGSIRSRKGITAEEIGFNECKNRIFINDHLTPKNQLLYKTTRDICKTKKAHCWTRDCKIYVKHPRTEKNIEISSEDTLQKIFGGL